ncbi:MAG TPA: EamA family transporter [Coriobacteriia bacterium]|nr:EamA family transporter [Coriobacteriia bacterium]
MLTVMLAVSTSALFGVGDFLGGIASRRESAIAVTAAAHGIGVVLFTLAVLLFPAPFSAAAIAAGVSAGVSGGIGVAALYSALARGRMSVVAPLTAALSGSLPALYDFSQGAQLGTTSLVGLALALLATIIVSASSSPEQHHENDPGLPPSAIVLSLVAGVAFAGSFISFSFAGDASGFWPLFAARVTSFTMLAALALIRRGTLRIDPTARRSTAGAGLLDAAANVTMISAIRIGPLAVASVLGSLYPVVTVLLARIMLGERLHGLQRFGVALALAAVVLAAWP